MKALILCRQKKFDELKKLPANCVNKQDSLLIECVTSSRYELILDELGKSIHLAEESGEENSLLTYEFETLLYHKCVFLLLKAKQEGSRFVFEQLEDHFKYERVFLANSAVPESSLGKYKMSSYIYFIGCVLLNSKSDTDAIKYFERALALDPANAYFIKAKVYYLLKKRAYARLVEFLGESTLRKVVLTRDKDILRFYLTTALVRLGQTEAAIEQLDVLLPESLHGRGISEKFCTFDLKYECLQTVSQLDLSKSFRLTEKFELIIHHVICDAPIRSEEDVNISAHLQLSVFFEMENACFDLFKAVCLYEEHKFDQALAYLDSPRLGNNA